MISFVLSIASALASASGHHQDRPLTFHAWCRRSRVTIHQARAGQYAVSGHNYTKCSYCKDDTWLYVYRGAEPLGACRALPEQQARRGVLAGGSRGLEDGQRPLHGRSDRERLRVLPDHRHHPLHRLRRDHREAGKSVTAFYSAGIAMVVPGMTVCSSAHSALDCVELVPSILGRWFPPPTSPPFGLAALILIAIPEPLFVISRAVVLRSKYSGTAPVSTAR